MSSVYTPHIISRGCFIDNSTHNFVSLSESTLLPVKAGEDPVVVHMSKIVCSSCGLTIKEIREYAPEDEKES